MTAADRASYWTVGAHRAPLQRRGSVQLILGHYTSVPLIPGDFRRQEGVRSQILRAPAYSWRKATAGSIRIALAAGK